MVLFHEAGICVVMAAPFFVVFSTLGSTLTLWIIRKLRSRRSTMLVVALPLAVFPAELQFSYAPHDGSVTTVIDIAAPPEVVWKQTVEIRNVRADELSWTFSHGVVGVPQPVDRIALHLAHRAGIVVGPDRLAAMRLLGLDEGIGDRVERVLPGDLLPVAAALLALAPQRLQQPLGVVEPVGIAGDLGADDPGGVAVVGAAAHLADAAVGADLDVERAGGGTVMGTDRMADPAFAEMRGRNVHGICILQGGSAKKA